MDLKERRKRAGISQTTIAKAIGIPQTTYANYETKHCSPSIDKLIKLADFFNISIDELVDRPTNMINLNLIDDMRRNLIFNILNSSDLDIARIDAFIQGININKKD